MKCVQISKPGGPEVLVLAERPAPTPKANEILVKVAAAGVNRPDIAQRAGKYPPPPDASDLPGLEIAGEVAACGAEVKMWKPGDQVCALAHGGGAAQRQKLGRRRARGRSRAHSSSARPIEGASRWIAAPPR